jgi:protein-S-isoprenylcysteine O-methyltransferase Ste14
MFILMRAIVYATVFMGFTLVFLPMRVLAWSGFSEPASIGVREVAGVITLIIGLALTLSCVFAFVFVGKGTPFPFDPPRRLVIRGPYTIIRNPMYIGAALAMSGAALYYGSWWLLGYVALFLLVAEVFVLTYEEPTLRDMFGAEYIAYCTHVGRWIPNQEPRT